MSLDCFLVVVSHETAIYYSYSCFEKTKVQHDFALTYTVTDGDTVLTDITYYKNEWFTSNDTLSVKFTDEGSL